MIRKVESGKTFYEGMLFQVQGYYLNVSGCVSRVDPHWERVSDSDFDTTDQMNFLLDSLRDALGTAFFIDQGPNALKPLVSVKPGDPLPWYYNPDDGVKSS